MLAGFPSDVLSEFEDRVFADGVVTQAEYDEAYHRWRTCAESGGVTVRVERDDYGLYVIATSLPIESATDEAFERDRQVSDLCEGGSWMLISAVYHDQLMNPDSRDWNEGVWQCLIDTGALDSDYTLESFLTQESPQTVYGSTCIGNPFGVSATQ